MESFQQQCKKMPKVLREYEAFTELKRTIDEFLGTLPLVQSLAHPAMRSRHWTQLMAVTGRQLAVHSETFKLSTLLDADLLEFNEDVEEITVRLPSAYLHTIRTVRSALVDAAIAFLILRLSAFVRLF